MSESTAAAPVAVESTAPAPTAAPEVQQVTTGQQVASTEAQAKPLNRREALASSMERARERYRAASTAAAGEPTTANVGGQDQGNVPAAATPSVTIDANGAAHALDGKYVTPPAAATAAVGTEPAAALPQPGTSASTPAAMPQEIRVPIPEGHSLREQGREYIIAAGPEQERDIRALLNSDTRRREVEAARQEAQQARAEALRYRAWVEAQAEWQTSAIDSGVLQQYEALKEVDPDVAEAFLAGKRLQMDADANQRFEAANNELQDQNDLQAAQVWTNEMFGTLSERLPAEVRSLPQYQHLFLRAVQQYGNDITAWQERNGQMYEPKEDDLRRYLQGELMKDDQVLDILRQKQAGITSRQREEAQRQESARLEAIRLEAERRILSERQQAERAQLAAAAQQPRHPMGALNGGVRGDLNSTAVSAENPARDLSGKALQRTLVQNVRARAAQYARR